LKSTKYKLTAATAVILTLTPAWAQWKNWDTVIDEGSKINIIINLDSIRLNRDGTVSAQFRWRRFSDGKDSIMTHYVRTKECQRGHGTLYAYTTPDVEFKFNPEFTIGGPTIADEVTRVLCKYGEWLREMQK
jgi:hypothetical protein